MSLASSLAMASVCLLTTWINPESGSSLVPYITLLWVTTLSNNPLSPFIVSSKFETDSSNFPNAVLDSFNSSLFSLTALPIASTSALVSVKSSLKSSRESLFLITVANTPFPSKGSFLTSSSVAVFLLTAPVVVSTSYNTSSPALKPFKVNVLL